MTIHWEEIHSDQILIAPAHLHNDLRRRLLTQSRLSAHITIVSLSAFLQRTMSEPPDQNTLFYQYREQLTNFPAKVYHSIFQSLDFIQQCHHFIEEMKLYGITLDELPISDEAQNELKQILSRLYPIITRQDLENQVMTSWEETDCAHVLILDNVYSAADQKRIEYLCAAGAKHLSLPSRNPHITYYHAVNKRKEVEAAAQMIIERELHASDIHIITCDPSYPSLIRQVFDRYHIPYTLPKQSNISLLSIKAQALLAYVAEPNMKNIIALLEVDAFDVPYGKEMIDYVKLFGKKWEDSFDHIQNNAQPSQLINEAEIQRLKILEERAQECKNALHEILSSLSPWDDTMKMFTRIGCLLQESISTHDHLSAHALMKIQEVMQSALPYVHDAKDIPFLIECLAQIHEQEGTNVLCGAQITSLHQPFHPDHLALVLGCTQNHYPAFPANRGLFDEAYVADIAHYPTLNQRHSDYMKQLESLLTAYEELIIAYPLGNYEGKANESSLEIEALIRQKPQFLEPRQIVRSYPKSDHISANCAQKLYLKQNTLHGSVSSFERYMKCPFSYFLTYGLKIAVPIDYRFSQNRIGTLSHHLLETLVKREGNAYTQVSRTEIEALLEEELTKLSNVYLLLKVQLPLCERRLADSLYAQLQDLHEMEQHSRLSPVACEAEFYWDVEWEEPFYCKLHGFIDRIDAGDQYIRIIDYKSSQKSMSPKNFSAGLQLQLVTYALYAQRQWNKNVLGAFYYSLKQENIIAVAGKMKRRPVVYVPYDESDWEEARRKEQRLQGWFMHPDVAMMDDNGSFIQGSRVNKDGEVTARKIYSMDQLHDWAMELYHTIAKRILSGDIRCEPVEEACQFCQYHDICRFHAYPRAMEAIIDMESEVKEDASME